jgi:uncharacterized protein YndB with AHSA1/START domain
VSQFTRMAATLQTLSLAAMEEASRRGLREADLDDLFLALVINNQSAGRALRSLGITLDDARAAVAAQHASELATLGITLEVPIPGRIVFHETRGYAWSTRTEALLMKAAEKKSAEDADAVLRTLVNEPSGHIIDLLARLNTSPNAVLDALDTARDAPAQSNAPAASTASEMPQNQPRGAISRSTEAFVPARALDVWTVLTDPAQIPTWEPGTATVDRADREATVGTTWTAHALMTAPDGKALRVPPAFRRRSVQLIDMQARSRVAWRFTHPDTQRSRATATEFRLEEATGGTQVTITTTWFAYRGWRRANGIILRPIVPLLIWMTNWQIGSRLSRAFSA